MVPFRLDQTAFNDQTPPVRTMADFFLGTQLVNSAAPTIGASAARAEDGPRPPLQPRRAAAGRAVHRRRAELRRQHRPLPERHAPTSTSPSPPPAASRRGGRSRPTATSATSTTRSRRPTTRCRPRSSSARTTACSTSASYTWSKSMSDAERDGGRRQHAAARRRSRASTCRTTSRSAPATSCRSAATGGSSSDAHAVVDGMLGGWQVQGIYVWRSGRPFTPTISSDRANTGVGGQRPNRLGSGELDEPDGGGLVRQDGVRAAGAVHLRRLRRQHPARGQLQDARLLAVQAVPDRHAPPAVPRRGVQPDQHAELQRARTPPSTRRPAGASRARRARRGRCSSR